MQSPERKATGPTSTILGTESILATKTIKDHRR